MKKLVRPNILSLTPYSSARDEYNGAEAHVFLDANESPYDTGINRYPDPLQRTLKQRIAEVKGVPAANIFLGNGSDEAIDLVFRVFCRPGVDNVVAIAPTYGMYEVCARINDVEYRPVPLTADFGLDVDALLAACDEHTKAIFICSPNNPTGNSFPSESIDRVLREFAGIVVVDEAYIDFSGQPSCKARLGEFSRLIVLQTLSKAWGSAAIRLGMAFASAEIIELYNKVKYPYNVNVLTQQRALMVLENTAMVQQEVHEILAERNRMAQALASLPCVEHVYPTDANFILARVSDADGIYASLVQGGIIVRNRTRVCLCNNCLRITIGLPSENDELLTALSTL